MDRMSINSGASGWGRALAELRLHTALHLDATFNRTIRSRAYHNHLCGVQDEKLGNIEGSMAGWENCLAVSGEWIVTDARLSALA